MSALERFHYNHFVLIIYLYLLCFFFIAWRYICLFCEFSYFKKICRSHPTESFNQYKISFFEKVKSSMLMARVLIQFYIFTYCFNTHMSLYFIFFVSCIDRFFLSGKEKYHAIKIQLLTFRSRKYCNIDDCFWDGGINSLKKLTFPVCLS